MFSKLNGVISGIRFRFLTLICGLAIAFISANIVGSIMLVESAPDFNGSAWSIIKSSFVTALPVLVIGLLLAIAQINQITRPLHRLTGSANQVGDGEMDQEVAIEGPREIRQLGAAFASMMTTLKQNIEQVYELAYVDRVTQLPNREFFRMELTRAIKRAVRQNSNGALLFVDLDGFKRVNDTYGHDIGDQLLSQFSERLGNLLRAEDLIGFETMKDIDHDAADPDQDSDELEAKKNKQMVARLGGDEFTILLSEIRDETDAATVSKRIIHATEVPFIIDGTHISIGASVGIATFPRDGSDYEEILKSADMAMYQAKEEGKNTFRYFSEELNHEASTRMQIESDLRAALDGNQFELHYHPKIDCASGLPKAVEALVRWNHPVRGMIQPLDFISVAEDCGLIMPLGKWVLEEACRQLVEFEKMGLDICVAVNISTAQFERADFCEVVTEALRESGADPKKLELEISESMAMQNPEKALSHMGELKKLGIRFAIDDFGTGYSNLSQLSRLPFDVFKIDRSFVDMLADREDEHGRIIVRTILAMANSLKYETVAEGVETIAQLEFLIEYGCTFAQGYYFARPMPVTDFVEWFAGWQKKDANALASVFRQGLV